MSDSTRTFVAIALPDRLGRRLARCQERLAPLAPAFRWPSSASFHATLAFLGNVSNNDLSRVCEGVAESARGFGPIELELRGLGAFPSPERPRVIWAGLAEVDAAPGRGRLIDLQKAVVRAVTRAGYRPDEEHGFHPHVTVGRIKNRRARPADLTAIFEQQQPSIAGTFTVTEVVTYSSTPGPSGPNYTVLARAPLEAEIAEPPP
jgi:2'-5' RNA ligase